MPRSAKTVDRERRLYEPVRTLITEILKLKFSEFHLEITANRTFSDKLKSQVGSNRDIVFSFLKDAAPDITGFIREQYVVPFIVVEIKSARLKLDDIYQAKKYAELFDAKYALLVSTEEIPEELKRLSKVDFMLFYIGDYKAFGLAQFDEERNLFKEYFPENPFLKTI
jgi:hypothetical protein